MEEIARPVRGSAGRLASVRSHLVAALLLAVLPMALLLAWQVRQEGAAERERALLSLSMLARSLAADVAREAVAPGGADEAAAARVLERERVEQPAWVALVDGGGRRIAAAGSVDEDRLAASPAGGGLTRAQAVPGAPGWRVVAGQPQAALDAALWRNAATMAALALLCLLIGLMLAGRIASRIAQPLRRLAAGTPAGAQAIGVREVQQLQDALDAARTRDALARAELQAQRDEFGALFELAPFGLALAHDSQAARVTANDAMKGLMGEDAAGAGLRLLQEGQPVARQDTPLARAAATGRAVDPQEYDIVDADGARPPRRVMAGAVPLLDAQGQPRGAVGAVVDLSERRRAEERLRDTLRELEASQLMIDMAQQAGGVGFMHHDFDGDRLVWTPSLATLMGLPAGRTTGALAEWLACIDPADRERVQAELQSALQARHELFTTEFCVSGPTGTGRWLAARMRIAHGLDGPARLSCATVDLSAQRVAERSHAALAVREKAARHRAEAAGRAKDEFLAILGHELRNPLGAISAAAQVVGRSVPAGGAAAQACDILVRQTRQLGLLLGELLEVGAVLAGRARLQSVPLDVSALVQRVVATFAATEQSRNHTVEIARADDAWASADAARLEQVVSQLLSNALRYTPPGGRITLGVRREGAHVFVSVRDDGVGIAPELLGRIFEPFVQGTRPLDRKHSGLGLGLTLVRKLVELHGGKIGARNLERGTEFSLRLPAIEAPDGEAAAAGEPAGPGARARTRLRLVVVDDNRDLLCALKATLEMEGHAVDAFEDGGAALDALLDAPPDAAVVDLGMPGLTGYDVARRARAAGFAGGLVALSGYSQEGDVSRSLRAGFDMHLAKPLDLEVLRQFFASAMVAPR